MADERELKAWEHWRESSEKLDYFILGTSSALTAYFGQHLPSVSLGLNAASLELISLTLLGLSVVAGVERLRASVAGLGAQGFLLEANGIAGSMRALVTAKPGTGLIDAVSGRTFTPDETSRTIAINEKRAASAQKQWLRWKRRGELAYKARDYLLILGIVAYVAAKIWAAFPR
jgi:hypothetical protein